MTRPFIAAVLAAGVVVAPLTAGASTLTFFGEDLNNSEAVPLPAFPNASAAETQFLSNLVDVETENFEGFNAGDTVPLGLTFSGPGLTDITATLQGGNGEVAEVASGTNGFGRYPISPTKYFEVAAGGTGNFEVSFDRDIAAFGFYGVDIGDFGGQFQLELTNDGNLVNLVTVPNTQGSFASTGGSVLYFGVIQTNAADVFDNVAFLTTTGQGDVFAFDEFTVGAIEQVVPGVPVPAALPLLLSALGGLAFVGRRRA